jgi:propanol-preferring alcohol dehydrogenase
LHNSCGHCKFCRTQRENYCRGIKATGWHENGGFAEYLTIPERNAVLLNDIPLEPADLAPLLCPGVAGYAALKLTEAIKGDKLGLYGFGPTAHCVLKVAKAMGIKVYVSTRSKKNMQRAQREGAIWTGNTALTSPPCKFDAAVIFPPAGNLVETALDFLEYGGTLVMAPVSSSPILIDNYSQNLWGRSIKTLFHVTKSDAEDFFSHIKDFGSDIRMGVEVFPFEALEDALIALKYNILEHPNAVIQVTTD